MSVGHASCCFWRTLTCGRFCRRLDSSGRLALIYHPDTERISHYFRAHLPEQFDAVLHIDETHALEPLETWSIR
jgi:erythromycin esterase-like protein